MVPLKSDIDDNFKFSVVVAVGAKCVPRAGGGLCTYNVRYSQIRAACNKKTFPHPCNTVLNLFFETGFGNTATLSTV